MSAFRHKTREEELSNLDNEGLDIETIGRVAARVNDLTYSPVTEDIS